MPFNPDDWEVVEPTVKIPGNPARNISVRQNNPFNLKGRVWGATGVGTRGFAIYPSPEAGVEAGINQIQLDQSRGMTFGQFAEKYAPSYENPTWAADVSRALGGVPANMPISQIPTMALAQVIARRESSTDIGNWGKRASKIGATMPKKKFNPDDWEVVEEQPAAPQPVAQPQPSLPWQIAKGLGGAALTAFDYPMKPVRAGIHAIESLGGPEQKIPGREQAQAMLQQINAARAKSGKPPIPAPKTGVYAATPNSPELYNLAAELSLMGPAYKAAGALIKGARGLPGVRGIPFIGRKAAQAAEVAPTGAVMGTSSMDIEAAINEQFGIESKAAAAAETLPPTGAPSPLTPEKVQNIVQSVSDKMGTGNPGVSQIIKQIQKLKEMPPWQRYGVQ